MLNVPRRVGDSIRLSLSLWAFLASAAAAAPIEAIPLEGRPAQLSLSFTAPPQAVLAVVSPTLPILSAPAAGLSVPASPASAAVPLAVAAVPVASEGASFWSETPPAVAQAFRSGDAREFREACRRADFVPPETDDAQQALLREGEALLKADRMASALFRETATPGEAPPPATRATKIDYAAFGRALARSPRVSVDIFADAYAKRALLKAAGYTRLYGSGGTRVAIDDASDARIGRAFDATVRAYRNRTRN